jgi:hypothetical protein
VRSYTSGKPWPGQPVPSEGFEVFMVGGDHFHTVTRVCVKCGAVVAVNFVKVHRGVCPGRES